MYAKTIVASTGSITPYIVAALFYLAITLPLAKIVGNLELKLAGSDTGSSTPVNGKKKIKFSDAIKGQGRAFKPASVVVPAGVGVAGSLGEKEGISPEQMSSL